MNALSVELQRRGRQPGDPPAPGFHRTRRGGLPQLTQQSGLIGWYYVKIFEPVGVANLATRWHEVPLASPGGVAERSESFKIMIASGNHSKIEKLPSESEADEGWRQVGK